MNLLDMRTVLSSYVISSLISAVVMASLWVQHRRRSPELAYWLADFIMQFLGLLLIVLRGNLPDFFSIVLANTLIIGGTLVLLIGLERFYGKANRHWFNYIYLGLFFFVQMYFMHIQPILRWRTINISAGILVMCGQCAWLLLRRVDSSLRPEARPAVIVFSLFSLVSLVRIFVDLVVPQGNDVFKSGLYDTLVILIYQMLFIGLTFALILMVNRRLNTALQNDIMERKLAEADLQVSEEKFSVAFHNSPDSIVISSLPDGKIIDANESFFNITGFNKEETLRKTTIELKLWDNLEQRNEFVNILQKVHRALNFEADFRKKSGELFTGLISGENIQLQGQTCVLSVIHDITERKLAEEALLADRNLLHTLIDNLPDNVFVKDVDSRIVLDNNAHRRLLGVETLEQAVGKTDFDFFPKEMAATFHADEKQIILSGESLINHEEPVVDKDCNQKWLLTAKVPLRDPQGKITGIVGISHDFTESRQAEQALAGTERIYRQAITRAGGVPYQLNYGSESYVFLGEGFERLTGYMPSEMTGPLFTSRLRQVESFGEHKDLSHEQHIRLARQGGVNEWRADYLFERKDGKMVWLADHSVQIINSAGKTTGALGILIDITERRQVEDALHQSEAELRALFASMHDVVVVIDSAGVYRKIAPTDPGLLVKPPEELLGKTLRDVFPPEQADNFLRILQQVLDTKQTAQIEYDLIIGDRTVRFETSISPMTEDRTLWVAHDITKRKRFELVQDAIFRIAQAAMTNDGIDALYRSIHSILGELIPTENFYIALYDPITELISFPYYIDQFDEPPTEATKLQGLTGYVMRIGRPLLATRAVLDRLVQQGKVELVGIPGMDWMGAPLKVEGRTIGVVAVQSYVQGIHFKQEDLNLLEFVSAQVAQAIERKRMEEEIRNLSVIDELTGLYNRRGFTILAEQEMKLARRFKRGMLLFFCDVDDLKVINDTHGHVQGDLALKEVSAILKETFREADIVARMGGDEFIVLAVDASLESADILTNRIQSTLEKGNQQGNRPYQLSLSLGIVHYDPEAPCTVSEMIAQADGRMYQQKREKKRIM